MQSSIGGRMPPNEWIDRAAYPFRSHVLQLEAGRMHYVDEGEGRPLVMVHGTPTWSFLYRHLIKHFSKRYRCIALDHIGFGLSDKPLAWSYRPEDHARNLRRLIEHLKLRDVTLIVHDFGGPIGLSYAIEQPENVRQLILFNTWMWPLNTDPLIERSMKLMESPIGKWLYLRCNFSARVMIPAAWGDRSKLTPALHRHYLKVFPHPEDRYGTWAFLQAVRGSSAWFDSLWERRSRIAHLPVLLLWGMKDSFLKPAYLTRWQTLFPHAQTVTFPKAGHFVQEEEPDGVVQAIESFL